ncbi:MAG: DUF2075 domain-containing protein [Variovorax sp.]|nr:MAG: DUF2075 domain-containing protein [Variovorax sp.]
MVARAYYADSVQDFLIRSPDEILGTLTRLSGFAVEEQQRHAWMEQVRLLQGALPSFSGRGKIYFEYAVPRLGKRIDVVLVLDHVIFVIEFKVGESAFLAHARDQVLDYAVDLKNFHETTHHKAVAPVLIATRAERGSTLIATTSQNDGVLLPIDTSVDQFLDVLNQVLVFCDGPLIDVSVWEAGGYYPTPTIVEAALALYGGHAVAEISRSDATARNLSKTATAISHVATESKALSRKSICFVTGVPGAGKTLVGLKVAAQHTSKDDDLHSVFLSGNGPLVAILQEALARDKVRQAKGSSAKITKSKAISEVKTLIQNVHHFRDECLIDITKAPVEHVAIFDEAQRAWDLAQTRSFMERKKQRPGFSQSEPEFLVSCMDRHSDWAVVVALVGGGQEINTGEAGISEWIRALRRSFPDWHIHISPRLHDAEYGAGTVLKELTGHKQLILNEDLHLSVSLRSFRSEHVSALVKQMLDQDYEMARATLDKLRKRYPIVITRDVSRAKAWLKEQARGTERYGMVVSSQAERLRPHAINVRSPMDPIHWFLDGKEDVRSSYYLEDVATEFHVQGLELDWACVVWDADFRYARGGWQHFSFVGSKWNHIHKAERQMYLKNAYRVLLTRARQGMVVVVPEGDPMDRTRLPAYYDPTFEYLKGLGFQEL